MKNAENPVGAMFGRIAGVYDFLNHFLSLGIDRRWRRELAEEVRFNGSPLLDLAAGTLDVALALRRRFPEARILAVDFCPAMLKPGLRKLTDAASRERVLPCAGDALAIPAKDDSFSSVTIAFGIRNIAERGRAFREMARVLEPGGRVCALEFGSGRERVWGGLYNIYLNKFLPRIGGLIARDKTAYSYLADTIRAFPAAPELAAEMRDAGLVNVGYRKLTSGVVCLHWGEKPA